MALVLVMEEEKVSMSVCPAVPSKGEDVTAHATLFTTEVDQRTDARP